jgi:dihydroxyacetone kinase
MAGFSISLMKLDEELRGYYDLPAQTPGFVKGEG